MWVTKGDIHELYVHACSTWGRPVTNTTVACADDPDLDKAVDEHNKYSRCTCVSTDGKSKLLLVTVNLLFFYAADKP